MTKHSYSKAKDRRRRSGMLLLVPAVVSMLLLSGCFTVNTPQAAPQPEQSTAVPENVGSEGGTSAEAPAAEAPAAEAPAAEAPAGSPAPAEGAAPADRLSEEEVIAIVLDRVPGATADEVISFGLDTDDGMLEYEGSLLHDGIEYEFEIDAVNGNILEWEIDD